MTDYLEALLDRLSPREEDALQEDEPGENALWQPPDLPAPAGAETPEAISAGSPPVRAGGLEERETLSTEAGPPVESLPDFLPDSDLTAQPEALDAPVGPGRLAGGEMQALSLSKSPLEATGTEATGRPALLERTIELEGQTARAAALSSGGLTAGRRGALPGSDFSAESGGAGGQGPQLPGRETAWGRQAALASLEGTEAAAGAVDRAFRRDSRRYDRGFCLY